MSSFIRWLFEATLPYTITTNIDGNDYKIIRTKHLIDKRDKDPKPKDYKMTKAKYQKLLELSLAKMTSNISYSVTWTYNNKSNVISWEKDDDKFYVFGAIMGSNGDYNKLYSKAQNRIHLGDIKL